MKSTKLFLLFVVFLASCATPATAVPVPTETSTLAPTATQTLIPIPTITPVPTRVGGGSGKFIFIYRKEEFLTIFPDLKGETNVFIANLDGSNLIPITKGLKKNNYLESVSPDGTKALISSTSKKMSDRTQQAALLLFDLKSLDSEPILLASVLKTHFGNTIAKWINSTSIVFIGYGKVGFGIYKMNLDDTNPINIDKGNSPFEILAINTTQVYWGTETHTKYCSHAIKVWQSSLEGNSERI